MRAHTEGKHEMGKRFAIVIGVAAAGVMALGAQTAVAGGEPVDSTKPDLQLSAKKTQHEAIGARTDCDPKKPLPLVCGACDSGACDITVKASCGDEACTPRAKGKVTKVKHDKLEPDEPGTQDLAPGETVGGGC